MLRKLKAPWNNMLLDPIANKQIWGDSYSGLAVNLKQVKRPKNSVFFKSKIDLLLDFSKTLSQFPIMSLFRFVQPSCIQIYFDK